MDNQILGRPPLPPAYSRYPDDESLCQNVSSLINKHLSSKYSGNQGQERRESARSILDRIAKHVDDRLRCYLVLDTSNPSAIVSENPTDPDRWDWIAWQNDHYQSGADIHEPWRYFERQGNQIPHRLLTYLNKRMSQEQLFELVQHENVASQNEVKAHEFSRQLLQGSFSEGLSTVYRSFQQVGVPLTPFIKTMIMLGYLKEDEISYVYRYRFGQNIPDQRN